MKKNFSTTSDYIRHLVVATHRDRSDIARFLGYTSEDSILRAEAGKQTLSADEVTWLAAYAQMRSSIARIEAKWLKKHPPPNANPLP